MSTLWMIALLNALFVMDAAEGGPVYFSIWLTNGRKLTPFLPQLLDQNRRFGDVLIVDDAVRPFVNDHGNVVKDSDVFERAKSKYPGLQHIISEMYGFYGQVKEKMPAAGSDILRFVSFLGLEGTEFVYHDVDVRIGNNYNEALESPFSSILIATSNMNPVSKNWVMRALTQPTTEINLSFWNWNTDLIAVKPAECLYILGNYLRLSMEYFQKMSRVRMKGPDGVLHTVMDLVTGKVSYPVGTPSSFVIGPNEDIKVFNSAGNGEERLTNGITLRRLQSTVVWGSSIHMVESVLTFIFKRDYHIPLTSDNDNPYSVAEKVFRTGVLELRGHTKGIYSFFLDFVADPVAFGMLSRKKNPDWFGTSLREVEEVPVLDCEPVKNLHRMFSIGRRGKDDVWYEADVEEKEEEEPVYESYEEVEIQPEEVEVKAEALAINLDGPQQKSDSILPSFGCSFLRRKRSVCDRDDESKYELSEDGLVLFMNKWSVFATSRYLILFDHVGLKTYKYTVRESLRYKVIRLQEQAVEQLERLLRLPSGRFASRDVNNRYNRLLSSVQHPERLRRQLAEITPVSRSMSNAARKFTRSSFGIGYILSTAFNTQFLASAIQSRNGDLVQSVALGTIGTVGLSEIAFVTSNKLSMMISATPIKYAAVFSNVFKAFGVATAVYFGVQSSIDLSHNPANVEAWWWLSRSVTIFTPLNKIFIPFDLTLIVTKQIVHASWQLSYQQNKLILRFGERQHYHAMNFFGIETSRTINIENNAAFRTAIVNPTVEHLAKALRETDAIGVVGYPETALCKSTKRLIFNNVNEFETDVNSVDKRSLQTEEDSLSTSRLQMCLTDEIMLCDDQENQSFWSWLMSVFMKIIRIRYRGADLGVGCILLDGSIPSGPACRRVEAIRSDIDKRRRVVIVDGRLADGNPHSLPIVHPNEYDFKFVSVSNGSIETTSVEGCEDLLKWARPIAPYVLTKRSNERDSSYVVDAEEFVERIDYLGVPSNRPTEFVAMKEFKSRIYLYRLNKDNSTDNFTVRGSSLHDNEFVLMETTRTDKWDVFGGTRANRVVLYAGSSIVVKQNQSTVDDCVTFHTIHHIDARFLTNATVSLEGSAHTYVLVGKDSNVVALNGSEISRLYLFDRTTFTALPESNSSIHVNGRDNLIFLKPSAIVKAYVNGSANFEVDSIATLHLLVTNNSQVSVKGDTFSQVYVYGLDDRWNVTARSNEGFIIDGTVSINASKSILFLPDYYAILRQFGWTTVVVDEIAKVRRVPMALRRVSDVFVKTGERMLLFVNSSRLTIDEQVTDYAFDRNINVTIPYQSRHRINFHGRGEIVTENMIECGHEIIKENRTEFSCKLLAHFKCDEAIKICRAA